MSLAAHRPRSVTEIVDASFVLYRAHFVTLVTVAVFVMVPVALVKFVAPAAFGKLLDFIANLVVPIAQGAITAFAAAAIERDETLTAGDALRSTSGQTGSLLAVQIVSGLMVMIGLVLLVVPGVIALAWTAVAIPVVMIERTGFSKAIERSRALGRGKRGHVLGTVLLAWGILFVLLLGAGGVIGLTGAGERGTELMGWLLFAVILPPPSIAMTLLYYDLRVRTESADLDAMISELPAPAAGA